MCESCSEMIDHNKKPNCLEKANLLVNGDRQADYGHPIEDFERVTGAAKAMGIDPANGGPLHHALYMVLVKVSRLVQTPDHADSLVDGPGYFATYEMVLERLAERDARANPPPQPKEKQ